MSSHPTDIQGSVIDALREAIEGQIPNSRAEINGGGGHFNIEVTSPVFAGKGMLESQRLVYGANTADSYVEQRPARGSGGCRIFAGPRNNQIRPPSGDRITKRLPAKYSCQYVLLRLPHALRRTGIPLSRLGPGQAIWSPAMVTGRWMGYCAVCMGSTPREKGTRLVAL